MKKTFLSLLLVTTTSYALPFNVAADGTLPSYIHPNSTDSAAYTVTNLTGISFAGCYVKYLPDNVTQVTTGTGVCGKTFTLQAHGQPNDSCILELTISGPANGDNPNPRKNLFVCDSHGTTCAGVANFNQLLNVVSSNSPLVSIAAPSPSSESVDIGTTQQYVADGATYADGTTNATLTSPTWSSSNTNAATITSTGLATGVGTGSANITASYDSITSSPATLSVKSTVLITNSGNNKVSYCTIQSNGSFGTCSTSSNTFSTPYGVGLNPTATTAYVVNQGNSTVSYCSINSDGSLSGCKDTSGTGFSLPYQVAINPTTTYAYVTNFSSNTVSYCPIKSDGSFGSCTKISETAFNEPAGVTINAAGTYAYITNLGNSTVSVCSINSNGGFGTCNTTNGSSNFSSPSGISINPAGTYAYIANNNSNSITYCEVSNIDGSLSSCKATTTITPSPFDVPSSVAINPNGAYAYVTNQSGGTGGTGTVVYCQINTDGSFGSCNTTGSGFNTPEGVSAT